MLYQIYDIEVDVVFQFRCGSNSHSCAICLIHFVSPVVRVSVLFTVITIITYISKMSIVITLKTGDF